MRDFISSVYKQLCVVRAKIKATRRKTEILQQLAADNPSCLIRSILMVDVDLGEHVAILGGAVLSKVSISDFSYISNNSMIRNVDIGKFCSISSNVQIGLGSHPSRRFVSTYPAFYSNENPGCPTTFRENKIFDDSVPKTVLNNDIWIGANVIIPGGIQIGTGAIVAAGAVVVKDVPPYAVVGGNPAKIIRYRFSDEQIETLLASEWWSWHLDKIRKRVDNFSDVEKFSGK